MHERKETGIPTTGLEIREQTLKKINDALKQNDLDEALNNARDLAYVGELTKDERCLFVSVFEKASAKGDRDAILREGIDLMEEELMPQCTTHEPQIFYLKTSGEFYEKLSEPQKAKQHFEKAVEIANTLAVTHPTRLMAILDLAQLVHRQNEKAKAAEILSDVLVAATKEVKLLSGEEAKESQKAIDVVQGQLDKWNK